MAEILVLGCGYTGSIVARRLARGGHTVVGVRRSNFDAPPGVMAHTADLLDPAAIDALPATATHAVLAVSADGGDAEAYRRAYIDVPAAVVAWLDRRPRALQRLVAVSSTGVYGHDAGETVDEATPPAPRTGRARTLLAGEEILLGSGHPVVVLRAGGIYGPGRTTLLRRIAAGEAAVPATPRHTNRIHVDDLSAAIEHMLFLESPEPLYLAVDREPADRAEVVRWLAERLGAPPPPVAADDAATGRGGDKRCSSDRLVASGFTFRYPSYHEGYLDLLRHERP